MRWIGGLLAAALIAVGGLGVWWVTVGEPRARERAAVDAADELLAALTAESWTAVAARVAGADGRAAVDTFRQAHADLEVAEARYVPEAVEVHDDVTLVDYRADLELNGLGPWSHDGSFRLDWIDGSWFLRWDPSVVHPLLPHDGRFSRTVVWPERAPILAGDGTPLVSAAGTVAVGVEPQRIVDEEQVVRALVDVAGADEDAVRALLARPGLQPDWFHPVIELGRERFEELDPQLRPVPGILFRSADERTGPAEGLALHVVGRTGPASAEQARELGAPYEEGQLVGQFGLERGLESQLAGAPELEVAIVDADGALVEVVHRVEGTDPEPVHTTLDLRVQRAVEQALAGIEEPAALVVVDIATGELRASASRPASGFNRAIAGRYPPGSSFKVVTGAALLGDGLGPDSVLECPGERSVGGRTFRNAGGLDAGSISLRQAMAVSCNTAFIGAAVDRSDAVLEAARAFGFAPSPDERPDLPLNAFGASFPEPSDVTELAAASIGQARVEASPAHMAGVAAAVASGRWRPLRLLTGTEVDHSRPIPGDAAVLGDLLREVVRSGTGQAAAVPGRPVAGKTGSAEFGTEVPPPTHAWFIGYRLTTDAPEGPDAEGLAFAVLVEEGGAGGPVAAPIAARLLSALP